MPVKVEVTEDDIKRGVRGRGTRCAIARALKRATGEKRVWASCGSLTIDDRHGRTVWLADTPARVIRFIQRFDNRDPVKPFAFSITLRQAEPFRMHKG